MFLLNTFNLNTDDFKQTELFNGIIENSSSKTEGKKFGENLYILIVYGESVSQKKANRRKVGFKSYCSIKTVYQLGKIIISG